MCEPLPWPPNQSLWFHPWPSTTYSQYGSLSDPFKMQFRVCHCSAQNPHWLPDLHHVKSKLFTVNCRVPHSLGVAISLTSLSDTLPRVNSSPATLASLLFFKLVKHASTSGPLHLLFPLAKMLFSLIFEQPTPLLPSGFCSIVILSERLPCAPYLKSCPQYNPHPLIFILRAYHCLHISCLFFGFCH